MIIEFVKEFFSSLSENQHKWIKEMLFSDPFFVSFLLSSMNRDSLTLFLSSIFSPDSQLKESFSPSQIENLISVGALHLTPVEDSPYPSISFDPTFLKTLQLLFLNPSWIESYTSSISNSTYSQSFPPTPLELARHGAILVESVLFSVLSSPSRSLISTILNHPHTTPHPPFPFTHLPLPQSLRVATSSRLAASPHTGQCGESAFCPVQEGGDRPDRNQCSHDADADPGPTSHRANTRLVLVPTPPWLWGGMRRIGEVVRSLLSQAPPGSVSLQDSQSASGIGIQEGSQVSHPRSDSEPPQAPGRAHSAFAFLMSQPHDQILLIVLGLLRGAGLQPGVPGPGTGRAVPRDATPLDVSAWAVSWDGGFGVWEVGVGVPGAPDPTSLANLVSPSPKHRTRDRNQPWAWPSPPTHGAIGVGLRVLARCALMAPLTLVPVTWLADVATQQPSDGNSHVPHSPSLVSRWALEFISALCGCGGLVPHWPVPTPGESSWSPSIMDAYVAVSTALWRAIRRHRDSMECCGTAATRAPAAPQAWAEDPAGEELVALAESRYGSGIRGSARVIVETDFRVYIYTPSDVELALFGSFCVVNYVFADSLVVAQLTRDSVQRAFDSGMTVEQIVEFLESCAHPEAIRREEESGKEVGRVPQTVIDQLRLWDAERRRWTAVPASLVRVRGPLSLIQQILADHFSIPMSEIYRMTRYRVPAHSYTFDGTISDVSEVDSDHSKEEPIFSESWLALLGDDSHSLFRAIEPINDIWPIYLIVAPSSKKKYSGKNADEQFVDIVCRKSVSQDVASALLATTK